MQDTRIESTHQEPIYPFALGCGSFPKDRYPIDFACTIPHQWLRKLKNVARGVGDFEEFALQRAGCKLKLELHDVDGVSPRGFTLMGPMGPMIVSWVFVSFVVSWMEELTAEAQRSPRDAKEKEDLGFGHDGGRSRPGLVFALVAELASADQIPGYAD